MEPVGSLHHTQESGGISRYLLWGIWLMWLPFLIQPGAASVQMPPSLRKTASLCGLALFLLVYLWATWQEADRLTRMTAIDAGLERRWWVSIGILTALSFVLPFVQGAWGLGGFIYTSASVAGRLTPRRAVLVFGSLMLLVALVGSISAVPWPTIALMLFLVPAVGATTASFTRAIRTNRELRLARREIARLAISEERLRFARDLHDLLGHTLSLITLKSELAGQLIPEDPAQAQREVRDIEAAARTALQEVREAVVGYRQSTTLASEFQRATELLSSAGIRCTIQNEVGVLPAPWEALLTWVMREGVTNVIRHSRATQCVISLTHLPGEVCLTIMDDGQGKGLVAGETAEYRSQRGNGLRGITERVAALDGRCEAGPANKQGFRLAIILPVPSTLVRKAMAPAREKAREPVL